jgi:hypothetical protein
MFPDGVTHARFRGIAGRLLLVARHLKAILDDPASGNVREGHGQTTI